MGWRAKFVFILMVYAAGFATAVYFLAPPPNSSDSDRGQTREMSFDSRAFTDAVNSGLHKGVDLTKDIARQASTLIKQELEQRRSRDRDDS